MSKNTLIFFSFLFLTFSKSVLAEAVYHKPEEWRGYDDYFADVFFSGYDENNEYLILVDTLDYGICSYINPHFEKENKKKFRKYKPVFLEYRCIKPETAVKTRENLFHEYIDGEYKEKLVGYSDENCNCSKWQFYEDRLGKEDIKGKRFIKKEKGACFGYRYYSWKEFKKLIPKIKNSEFRKNCGGSEDW